MQQFLLIHLKAALSRVRMFTACELIFTHKCRMQMNLTISGPVWHETFNVTHRAPEILFRPELIGRDNYGMHESVFRCFLQSDIDLRFSFVGKVLLVSLRGCSLHCVMCVCVCVLQAGTHCCVSRPGHQDVSAKSQEFDPQIVCRKRF